MVVFPAEPVIPTVWQGTFSMKICVSLVNGIPRRLASTTMGLSAERHRTGREYLSCSRISTGWLPNTQVTAYRTSGLASAICLGWAVVVHGHMGAVTRQPARSCLSLAGSSENGYAFSVPVCFHGTTPLPIQFQALQPAGRSARIAARSASQTSRAIQNASEAVPF